MSTMNVRKQYEVRRLFDTQYTTETNSRSRWYGTFNTEIEALAAIQDWLKENLCPDGHQAINSQFVIHEFTLVTDK